MIPREKKKMYIYVFLRGHCQASRIPSITSPLNNKIVRPLVEGNARRVVICRLSYFQFRGVNTAGIVFSILLCK